MSDKFECPKCGLKVTQRIRRKEDEDGRMRYGGTYYCCPNAYNLQKHAEGETCDYSLSWNKSRQTFCAEGEVAHQVFGDDIEDRIV